MTLTLGRFHFVWFNSYFGDIWHRRIGYRVWVFHLSASPGGFTLWIGPLWFWWTRKAPCSHDKPAGLAA